MLERLAKIGDVTLGIFLPQYCLCCRREGNILCPACRNRLAQVAVPFCARCGLPQTTGRPCPDCSGQNFVINGIRSVFLFEGLLRKAVHHFKYDNLRTLARPLAEAMADYLKRSTIPVDMLVPVPLHPTRLRERGYNQSLLLAREMGKMCGLPVEHRWLERKVNTLPQAKTTDARERHQNMQDVFFCHPASFSNKNILLVDDVATTGATLNACAAALKRSQATSIWGLTVAREV